LHEFSPGLAVAVGNEKRSFPFKLAFPDRSFLVVNCSSQVLFTVFSLTINVHHKISFCFSGFPPLIMILFLQTSFSSVFPPLCNLVLDPCKLAVPVGDLYSLCPPQNDCLISSRRTVLDPHSGRPPPFFPGSLFFFHVMITPLGA